MAEREGPGKGQASGSTGGEACGLITQVGRLQEHWQHRSAPLVSQQMVIEHLLSAGPVLHWGLNWKLEPGESSGDRECGEEGVLDHQGS